MLAAWNAHAEQHWLAHRENNYRIIIVRYTFLTMLIIHKTLVAICVVYAISSRHRQRLKWYQKHSDKKCRRQLFCHVTAAAARGGGTTDFREDDACCSCSLAVSREQGEQSPQTTGVFVHIVIIQYCCSIFVIRWPFVLEAILSKLCVSQLLQQYCVSTECSFCAVACFFHSSLLVFACWQCSRICSFVQNIIIICIFTQRCACKSLVETWYQKLC